jgi:hypothetical protein
VLTPEAQEHLNKYLNHLYNYRDRYFGNARTVRTLFSEIVKNQNLRLASLPTAERSTISDKVITLADVKLLKMDKGDYLFNKSRIGFEPKK